MERRTVLAGVSAFLLFGMIGFTLGINVVGPPGGTVKSMNVNVSAGNGIATASFANTSVNLMYENSPAAVFYLDVNRDGSFDRVINVTRDGEIHVTSEIVSAGQREYRLYLRYRDDPERKDDGWMKLYRIRELPP